MVLLEYGKIQNGSIVLSKPLTLPEGMAVVVYIEPLGTDSQAATLDAGEDFTDLPFFGMWADREDMSDSAEWVRRKREQWHHRAVQQG